MGAAGRLACRKHIINVCVWSVILPIEISVTTVSISLMCQLDLFIVLSNEPETNGCWVCVGGGDEKSPVLLPSQTSVLKLDLCSYFISLMSAFLVKFM